MPRRLLLLAVAFALAPAVLALPVATASASTRRATTGTTRLAGKKSKPKASVIRLRAPTATTVTTMPLRVVGDSAAWAPVLLQGALDTWFASKPAIGAVAVAIAAPQHTWSGAASRPGGPAVQVAERFPVLSVTKTFTAALVLRAADLGLLALDAPVPDIAGLHRPSAPVTARQLLTHTSGLVDYAAAPNYRAGAPLTALDAVNLSTDLPLAAAPGSAVAYANSNYLYLELILEQVTGKPYGTLIAELATEVGLTATTLEPPDHNGWYGGGSGGLHGTVADLARWGAALFTPDRVLRQPTLAQMTTMDWRDVGLGTWPICPCSTDALGVRLYTAVGHHTARGALEFYPGSGLVVAVHIEPSSNEAGGLAAELGLVLSRLFATR